MRSFGFLLKEKAKLVPSYHCHAISQVTSEPLNQIKTFVVMFITIDGEFIYKTYVI